MEENKSEFIEIMEAVNFHLKEGMNLDGTIDEKDDVIIHPRFFLVFWNDSSGNIITACNKMNVLPHDAASFALFMNTVTKIVNEDIKANVRFQIGESYWPDSDYNIIFGDEGFDLYKKNITRYCRNQINKEHNEKIFLNNSEGFFC